jgi:hypothetical protein
MKVSIQFSRPAGPAGVRKDVMLDDLELDTALALSSALHGLEGADLDAVIVVREPRGAGPGVPARRAQPGRMGWVNRLFPRFAAAMSL